VSEDDSNTAKDLIGDIIDLSSNGYKEIGTYSFDKRRVCQSTRVMIRAATDKNWANKVAPELAQWSDGYQLDMRIQIGETMTAGALAGTCIANSKGGAAVCLQASTGDDDGLLTSNSILMRTVPAKEYIPVIQGKEEAQFPVNFDNLAEF
jgi:hypothetical protein